MSIPPAKYYLAGPMSGLPERGFPAFHAAAKHLRSLGLNIISPAELEWEQGLPVDGDLPRGSTYGDVLGRDVKIIIDDVIGIILLPGWLSSTGASIEAFVGIMTEKTFFRYQGEAGNTLHSALLELSPQYIKEKLL